MMPIYSNTLLRGLYATDASMYQIQPLDVVTPENRDATLQVIRECAENGKPLLARGAGTSLTGQSIGEAVVLDLSKHLTTILEINYEQRWCRVEPGVICGELNKQLQPHGLHFAPDPATQNRAAIGGIIANNSAGMRSIRYGMAIDHVLELDIALATGEVLKLTPLDENEFEAKRKRHDREGEIYRGVQKLLKQNADEISERYPKVIRHSGGYALDALLKARPFNLAKLVCGSEGTLGIILEAKLHLSSLPKYSAVCLAHFDTLDACLGAAALIVDNGASAAELIDGTVIIQAKKHPLTRDICSRIEGDHPAAVMIIETQGEDAGEVAAQINNISKKLSGVAYAVPVLTDPDDIDDVWQMRSSALGLMTTVKGTKKPVPYIEDAAVPLEYLADYVEEVLAVCKKYNQPVSMFGHASVGLIHIRPLHDLHQSQAVKVMGRIQEEVFQLVLKYHGSWSGEHGDGIVRGQFNQRFFGRKLFQAFEEVKRLFDPENRMNPGKIINTIPADKNLRFGQAYYPQNLQTRFQYKGYGSLLEAVEQCTGVGACRKTLSGVMCPSYMATRDEVHSTRGRANALRLALSGQLGKDALASEELMEVLVLCLGCKGCKGECPNGIDMTRYKAEALYHYQMKHGVSLRTRLFAALPFIARLASGPQAGAVNWFLGIWFVRKLLEQSLRISSERKLPRFTEQRLSHWYAKRISPQSNKQVVLFNDTYSEYFQPQVGRAAIKCLEAAGYHVILATLGDSQRIAITHGLLTAAKIKGTQMFQQLEKLLDDNQPLLVCEPSCASSLADDLPDLLDDSELSRKIADQVIMFDHFLEQEISAGNATIKLKESTEISAKFLVHGHCHQKTLDGGRWTHKLLQRIPGAVVTDSEAGCCGMAGTFGYEKEHATLSKKIAGQRLLPELNKTDNTTIVVSNGFSCRQQIADLAGKKPVHVAEALQMFI